MIKTNRILALVLALAALAALLAGCGVDPADRCVKNDGGAVSIPALKLNFAFDDFWFPVTEEEFNAIGEKIGKGIDVPESAWDKIIEEYNSVREQLGLEPITIDIKTGNLKEIGNDAKVVKGSFKEAASAVGSLGSALSGLDDPGAKIAGTVAQAIANIALAFSSADLKDGETGNVWYWIAATAAGLATMVSTISSIHAATNYAEGGMIKGNSYSGDNIGGLVDGSQLVGLNAGEVVLNASQQNALAQQITGGGMGNISLSGRLRGTDIILSVDRTLQSMGRGELLVWK